MHAPLDWNLVKSFIAVAQTGSLSKAALTLGLTQPTLSRQIHQLEQVTELNLFERSSRGLKLTEQGATLLNSAKAMQAASDEFSRVSLGESEKISGTVRISANEVVAYYLLPNIIAKCRQEFPDIQIELVVSNQSSSLVKRDADIALRMFEVTQPDLIRRKLADLPLAIYGHKNYLKTLNKINSMADVFQANVIGFDRDTNLLDGAKKMGVPLSSHDFPLRCDAMPVQIALARAGAGLVFTHQGIAEQYDELDALAIEFELPTIPLWLVCHSDVQHNVCIRRIMDVLAQTLSDDAYNQILL
jgi:DNA-binding transcriptional LysR family regulator